jgi:hypothetical protein
MRINRAHLFMFVFGHKKKIRGLVVGKNCSKKEYKGWTAVLYFFILFFCMLYGDVRCHMVQKKDIKAVGAWRCGSCVWAVVGGELSECLGFLPCFCEGGGTAA